MYSMGYDPEAIYQDADIEMAEIREAARELEEEARALGISVERLLEQREAEIEAEILEEEAWARGITVADLLVERETDHQREQAGEDPGLFPGTA